VPEQVTVEQPVARAVGRPREARGREAVHELGDREAPLARRVDGVPRPVAARVDAEVEPVQVHRVRQEGGVDEPPPHGATHGVAQPLGAGPRRAVHVEPGLRHRAAARHDGVELRRRRARRDVDDEHALAPRGVGRGVARVHDERPGERLVEVVMLVRERAARARRRVVRPVRDRVVPERAGAGEHDRAPGRVAGGDAERVARRRTARVAEADDVQRPVERVADGHAQGVAHAGPHERAGDHGRAARLGPRQHRAA
jgi:hypothetical protein